MLLFCDQGVGKVFFFFSEASFHQLCSSSFGGSGIEMGGTGAKTFEVEF